MKLNLIVVLLYILFQIISISSFAQNSQGKSIVYSNDSAKVKKLKMGISISAGSNFGAKTMNYYQYDFALFANYIICKRFHFRPTLSIKVSQLPEYIDKDLYNFSRINMQGWNYGLSVCYNLSRPNQKKPLLLNYDLFFGRYMGYQENQPARFTANVNYLSVGLDKCIYERNFHSVFLGFSYQRALSSFDASGYFFDKNGDLSVRKEKVYLNCLALKLIYIL